MLYFTLDSERILLNQGPSIDSKVLITTLPPTNQFMHNKQELVIKILGILLSRIGGKKEEEKKRLQPAARVRLSDFLTPF